MSAHLAVSDVTTVDPLFLALVSMLGGLAVTVIAAFVGAWIQSRREHAKWLREKRYDAYAEFSEYLHRNKVVLRESNALLTKAKSLEVELDDSSTEEGRSTILAELGQNAEQVKTLQSALEASREESYSPVAAVMILGPDYVRRAAQVVIRVPVGDKKARTRADNGLDQAMRRALGIKD